METISKWNHWANAHTNVLTDALRILFGGFIFFKGVYFLDETDNVYDLFKSVGGSGMYMVLLHYVALSHLCGGLFIVLGLLTRWCAALQLPILLGAILINFIGEMNVSNLLQATIGFVLCCFFVYYGSGRHSIDYNLKLRT
jgi:putative oxidoreductase